MARSNRHSAITEAFHLPWWLGESHTCAFCLQRFTYESRFHCLTCDRDMCPECVVIIRETSEMHCSECVKQNERS